jgi:hypothetical protein
VQAFVFPVPSREGRRDSSRGPAPGMTSSMKLGLACAVIGLLLVSVSLIFGGGPAGRVPLTQPPPVAQPVKTRPPDAGDRNDRNALDAMRRNGADLSKPTRITFYLYVPKLTDAREAADALEQRGFSIVLERPLRTASNGVQARTDWGVEASRTQKPTAANLRAARAMFNGLALRLHGTYDGWEAGVVR